MLKETLCIFCGVRGTATHMLAVCPSCRKVGLKRKERKPKPRQCKKCLVWFIDRGQYPKGHCSTERVKEPS